MKFTHTGTRMLVAAVAAAAIVPAAAGAAEAPVAQAARTLNVTESARLSLVRRDGNRIYERGRATGTLPGRVTAYFDVGITRVTGRVTIYPDTGGSLTLNVNGTPQSSGRTARFTGILAVRSGTGRYSRAVGSGTFDGGVNRDTWAATVVARARITF